MKKLKELISRFAPEDRAGFYITAIFHLAVIIVLLILQIGAIATRESSFVLDFSRQEEKERVEEEKAFREDISRKLDEMIAAAASQPRSDIRNIAVNASSPLKDDRGTDAEKLYEDYERLAKSLSEGKSAVYEDAREETVDISDKKREDAPGKEFKGPSVLTYDLKDRIMVFDPKNIPAYRCMGAGDVVVIIKVDRQGNVKYAKVYDALSSSDPCLRKYAEEAALKSKFTKSETAPANQPGEIVYRFIAQ